MTQRTIKFRPLRKIVHVWERTVPFLRLFFTRRGMGSKVGRRLIWGKFRRVTLSAFPPLTNYLRRKYGLTGGCISCGNSCNLMFQCPHWDSTTRLCTVYEDRPNICRTFPITPGDLKDRDLVNELLKHDTRCGFTFEKWKKTTESPEKR